MEGWQWGALFLLLDDWPMQTGKKTLILQSDLTSSAWKWRYIHCKVKSGSASIWFLSTLLVATISEKYHTCSFLSTEHGLFKPWFCVTLFIFTHFQSFENVWMRKGAKQRSFMCIRGLSYSETHQSWAQVRPRVHVSGQRIWTVGEFACKYQWGHTPPESVEIRWLKGSVSSSDIRNLRV